MSISNQRWTLFNSREVAELANMLSSKDKFSKLLALEIMSNTTKRFQKRDAAYIMRIVRDNTTDLLLVEDMHFATPNKTVTMNVLIGGVMQQITYNTAMFHLNRAFGRGGDKEKYPDQAYAYDLIEKVKFIHKHGLGKTEQDKNKHKKREYRRSAKNHYS